MTMTGSEAFQSILEHRQSLGDGVVRHADALREAVQRGPGWEPAVAALVGFLAEEVLPHTTTEEESILRRALAHPELGQPVATLIDEHRALAKAAERLATAESEAEVYTLAATISSLFTTHVRKENEVIVPLLSTEPAAELPAVLAGIRSPAGEEGTDPSSSGQASDDTVASLTSLLLDAASELANAGQGDRACQLAAQTWALLRAEQPRLAVRVTAKLHHLARAATAEPVTFTTGPKPAPPGALTGVAELDVRSLAPAPRHERIFATYAALGPGTGFVLVNDHDPKPLRYQFEAEHAGDFTWEALEEGPEVWRVLIGRPAASAQPGGDEPELDVRRLPHGRRHDIIFATYQALAPGGGFVLVNDHDPVPLRYQFEAQFAGDHSWDYLQAGPDLWRVRIGRPASVAR